MKTSGASDRSQSAAKDTTRRAAARQAPAAEAKAADPKPAKAPAKPVPAAPAPDRPKRRPAAAATPAAKAAAPKPTASAPPEAKPPAPKSAAPKPPTPKTVSPKSPPPKPSAGAARREPSRPAAAQPAAVNAASVRSVAPPASLSASAPPPRAKAAAKPQIETSHIVTVPANDVHVPPAEQPAEPVAARPAEAARPSIAPGGRPAPVSRAAAKEENFAEGDYVVYPTHGVGKVEKIAKEHIAGHDLELIHITFEENRMTLRVPVSKARTAGLRKLATRKTFDDALAVLKGRARVKRTMWSRRAQEYEAKINSGDPAAIAEVVRDLHRNAGQPDQSFSERQIYEAAMDRLAAELAALDQTDKMTALVKLGNFLKTIA
jgi:CarD family transcriptional regulator